MKKTLIKLCSVAVIGLALTACNNDAANKAAIDADNTAIDQMVQDKVKVLDDSLGKVCDDAVLVAAQAKLEAETPKGGGKSTAHHTTPAAPKAEPKKEEPKPTGGGMHGKSDQAGSTTGGGGMHSKSDQNQAQQGTGGMHSKADKK